MYWPRVDRAVASSTINGARSVADATGPPPPRAWPAFTVRSVVPRAAMRSLTDCCAPRPSATIAITAPTPITMPSIVRNERSLFACSASNATWIVSPKSMLPPASPAATAAHADARRAAAHALAQVVLLLRALGLQLGDRNERDLVALVQAAHDFRV